MGLAGNSVRDFTSNRKEGSEISKLSINMLVQTLYREEEVGFVGKFCWEG